MNRRRAWIGAGALAVAALATGIGVAAATASGQDNETPITGSDLTKASEAALEHTGGGRVTDTEVGDEESYYEVEVTLGDGREVDVQLDEGFDVVSSSDDDDENADQDDREG